MNLYLRHIGDFNNATRHLTRVERSVYSDSIELYYDTEQPLQCVDIAALERRLLCRSDDEKCALKAILAEFFVLTDAGYTHARCDAEIAKYRANTSAKARAGIASAAARKQNLTAGQQKPTPVEHTSTNRKPLTVNHKPMKRAPAAQASFVLPDWIPGDVWTAYLETRKAKKAKSTTYALNLVIKTLEQIRDSGHSPIEALERSIKGGWTDVYAPKPEKGGFTPAGAVSTVPSRQGPDPELLKAEADSKNRAPMPDAVREFKSRMKQGATT